MEELSATFEAIRAAVKSDDSYLLPSDARRKGLAALMKQIFDIAAKLSSRPFGPLSSLVIEGMDEDTIWEEIQTYVKPMINYYERKTKKLTSEISKRDQLRLAAQEAEPDATEEASHDSFSSEGEEESGSEGEEVEDGNSMDDDEDAEEVNDDSDEDENEDDEDDGDEEDDEERGDNNIGDDMDEVSDRVAPSTQYDSDEDVRMEAWLDDFEALENKHQRRQELKEKKLKMSQGHGQSQSQSKDWDEEDEDDEDDLSLVQKAMYDSEDDEDEDDEEEEDARRRRGGKGKPSMKDGSEIRYEDFFLPPNRGGKKAKAVAKDHEEDEDGDEGDWDEEQDDYEDSASEGEQEESRDQARGGKSKALSKKDEALRQQVAELERSLVSAKSWEYRGEVKAADREVNSLLSVYVESERGSAPAPLITQEVTSSIEQLIIKRIQEERWDDVVRRAEKKDIPDAPFELSQEKSKEGLAAEYAQDYAKQVLGEVAGSEEEEALRGEVLALFNKLSRELDKLSHFFYTPKPVLPEASAQVLANERMLPALDMEAGRALAEGGRKPLKFTPEEIANRPRTKLQLMQLSQEAGHEAGDAKQLRRKLKAQWKKSNERDGVGKGRAGKDKDSFKGDKRVTVASNKAAGGKAGGTSKDFFSRLQEESRHEIEAKRKAGQEDGPQGKASKRSGGAAAFKL
eukprot:gene32353-39126_t